MSKLDDIFGGIVLTDKHRQQIKNLILELMDKTIGLEETNSDYEVDFRREIEAL